MNAPSPTRRRVLFGAVMVGIAACAGGAWLVGSRVQSPAQAAARAAAPAPSAVTAPVESRVLSSTVIVRGDITAASQTDVSAPSRTDDGGSGPGVVTAVFVQQGDSVNAGDRLVDVAGRPVFVFAGTTPAFRPLRPGMSGTDVAQLQEGLVELGCAAGDSAVYDDATKRCVETMYRDAGYEVVQGSDTEVADLAAAAATVAAAEERVVDAQSALTDAATPPTAGEVALAAAALGEAQRGYDAAVRNQPVLIANALGDLDDALAAANALLAGSNPTAAAPAGQPAGTDDGGTDPAATPAAGGVGVHERDTARRDLGDTAAAVEAAAVEGANSAASAGDGLTATQAALDDLTTERDVSAEQLAVERAEAELQRATDDQAALQAVSGAIVPYGEVVFVDELPGRVGNVSATVGSDNIDSSSGGPASGPLLTVASSALQAVTSIPQQSVGLVHEGTPVELLDDLTGESVEGTLASVDDTIEISPTSGQPGYRAVIDADLPDSWSGRNVRVTFSAASTDGAVLVVPSAAVSSAADGTTRVQVERTDRTVDTVEVTTGLVADGFVEVQAVEASLLAEGDRVVIGT